MKDDEVSRLLASYGERDVAVGVAEARAREAENAHADAARAATELNAARSAEQAAAAAAAAARAAAADAAAAHAELQRQVGEKSSRITELEQQVDEMQAKRQRAEEAAQARTPSLRISWNPSPYDLCSAVPGRDAAGRRLWCEIPVGTVNQIWIY